jgi:hypothetical protein
MFARIINACVAVLTEEAPELGPGECALIVEVGPEVRVGWLWSPEGCVAPPEATLAEVKSAKQAEIRDEAEATLAGMKAEYCATEITTWDQQYAEAEAFTANSSAPVPLLTAIAGARGQAVADLAAAILSNRAAWVVISGTVVGQRLAFQDRLDAAQTVAEAEAITVSYSLPGA